MVVINIERKLDDSITILFCCLLLICEIHGEKKTLSVKHNAKNNIQGWLKYTLPSQNQLLTCCVVL